jgi:hypothetical protein
MADLDHEVLADAIGRYGQVAEHVNEREMKRFAEQIRQRWRVDPPDEWEEHGAGYTEERAYMLCVFQEAFEYEEPERHGTLCEAEQKDQVLLHWNVDDLVDKIPKPLATPLPPDELEAEFKKLEMDLVNQVGRFKFSAVEDVQLPTDFKVLMSITNGVYGAGVPAETAHTSLVYPLRGHGADQRMLDSISGWAEPEYVTLAAWKIGSCVQHREIFYVLAYGKHDRGVDCATWRIFDRNDVELRVYDNLTAFLQNQTAYIERSPRGHIEEHIVMYSSYPIH